MKNTQVNKVLALLRAGDKRTYEIIGAENGMSASSVCIIARQNGIRRRNVGLDNLSLTVRAQQKLLAFQGRI